MVARVTSGLTVQGAASWNQTRQTNSPVLVDNNPASNNYGHADHAKLRRTGANCTAIANPFGPIGSPTANAPPMQFSLRARYEWPIRGLQFLRASRRLAQRPFVHAGGIQSNLRELERHRHVAAAVREPGVFELFRLGRHRQGSRGTRLCTARIWPTRTPPPSPAPTISSSNRRRCGRACSEYRSATVFNDGASRHGIKRPSYAITRIFNRPAYCARGLF